MSSFSAKERGVANRRVYRFLQSTRAAATAVILLCELCQTSVTSPSALADHWRKNHRKAGEAIYDVPCIKCGNHNTDIYEQIQHLKTCWRRGSRIVLVSCDDNIEYKAQKHPSIQTSSQPHQSTSSSADRPVDIFYLDFASRLKIDHTCSFCSDKEKEKYATLGLLVQHCETVHHIKPYDTCIFCKKELSVVKHNAVNHITNCFVIPFYNIVMQSGKRFFDNKLFSKSKAFEKNGESYSNALQHEFQDFHHLELFALGDKVPLWLELTSTVEFFDTVDSGLYSWMLPLFVNFEKFIFVHLFTYSAISDLFLTCIAKMAGTACFVLPHSCLCRGRCVSKTENVHRHSIIVFYQRNAFLEMKKNLGRRCPGRLSYHLYFMKTRLHLLNTLYYVSSPPHVGLTVPQLSSTPRCIFKCFYKNGMSDWIAEYVLRHNSYRISDFLADVLWYPHLNQIGVRLKYIKHLLAGYEKNLHISLNENIFLSETSEDSIDFVPLHISNSTIFACKRNGVNSKHCANFRLFDQFDETIVWFEGIAYKKMLLFKRVTLSLVRDKIALLHHLQLDSAKCESERRSEIGEPVPGTSYEVDMSDSE